MSKSLGNVLDPFEVIDEFGTDALRFYLMREVQFGQDGNVGLDGVRVRYDTELANDYGNLASRTIAMIARYADGIVPAVAIDPELAAEFDEPRTGGRRGFDRFEVTQALELIWQRVRRLNRYVEEQKPWELARDPAAAARLETVLASLHQGLRAVTVELEPYMPEASATVLAALDATPLEPIPPLFPKPRSNRSDRRRRLVDSHTHLSSCEPPDDELVAAALEAGRHAHRHDRHRRRELRRSRSPPPSASPRCTPRSACTPTRRPASATATTPRWQRLARAPALRRDRRDRPRLLPRARAARGPGACVQGADRDRARRRQAGGDPHARRRRRHARDPRRARQGREGDPALLLDGRARSTSASRTPTGTSRSPATSPIPKNEALRAAMLKVPAGRLLVETDAPYLSPQPVRGKPNVPANVVHDRAGDRARAPRQLPRLQSGGGGGRGRRVRLVMCLVKLGQNFLVDRNILDVIERLAALSGRGRRARGRRRARRALERLAQRAAACTSSSSTAASRATCAACSSPTRTCSCTWATRSSRSGSARPGADEDGRQPALRCRRDRDPAHRRRAAEHPVVGRDGAARGRRALRRQARAPPPTACPRCSPSSSATSRCCGRCRRQVFRPVPNVDSVLLGLSRSAWPAGQPQRR